MTRTDAASRKTPLADDARMNFRAMFGSLPFGGMAHFEWGDVPHVGRVGRRVITLGDVFDNLQRLQAVLLVVAEKATEDAVARAELDRDLAGAGRLLARLLVKAEGS